MNQLPLPDYHIDKRMNPQGRILVVDDQPLNVKLLNTILTRHGYEVLATCSGLEALSIAHENLPDIILLDITMPEMDGFQTCQQLKADPVSSVVPVIFISALSEVADKVNAFKYGGVDYITKPFHKEEVLSRVDNHLRIYRLQRSLDEKNIHLERTQQELTTLNQLLATYNDKLEDMVKDRTEKLDATNRQLSASLKEKEILLKEVHHRVRNNLQIISSMLQLGFAHVSDPEVAAMFRSSYSRVKVLAVIHDKLCESADFSSVNVEDFINILFSELASSYANISTPVLVVDTNIDSLNINLMICIGLILNELISNSIRHAFTKGNKGVVTIAFNKSENGQYSLMASDNGTGIVEDNPNSGTYAGMQIVKDLVASKLKGHIEISANNVANNGTTVTIIFKETTGRYHNIV